MASSEQRHAHRDPNTLSNYHQWRPRHVTNDFAIDFGNKRVHGSTRIKLQRIGSHDASIKLDTNHLDIKDVRVTSNGTEEPRQFALGEQTQYYGQALEIRPREDDSSDLDVHITFATTAECTALQWLAPEQTDSGVHPYMFSQCQAIHARSMFPCFDTPDAKTTFDFKIHSKLPVMASGIPLNVSDSTHKDAERGMKTYTFAQKVPIPAYLFALASGEVETARVGPRSTVYASPSLIRDCKWELEEHVEKFIQTAERLVTPYVWGQYNVLVLPGSFPFGGMENPTMSFVSPTVISADRQNIHVVAHELSHSWSGNLVTNASWEHFWLNEGWTTYLERRIDGELHGSPAEDFAYVIGRKELNAAIAGLGEDSSATQLIIDHKGKDPDELFSVVPYEKGSTFLRTLEAAVRRTKWDTFIPHYFNKYKERSLDSDEFKAEVLDFFSSDPVASKALHAVDWDAWFYKPGYPPNLVLDTTLSDVCGALSAKWERVAEAPSEWRPKHDDVKDLSANQIVVFLSNLIESHAVLSPTQIEEMGTTYGFLATTSLSAPTRNVEVLARYYTLGLGKSETRALLEPTADLLSRVGRIKFVRKLYASMMKTDVEFARRTFEKNKGFYHPICRGLVEKVVEDQSYQGLTD